MRGGLNLKALILFFFALSHWFDIKTLALIDIRSVLNDFGISLSNNVIVFIRVIEFT